MDWFRLWWRQSDHYERLIGHLGARGLVTLTRATTGGIAGGLAVMAVATLWIPGGPQGVVAQCCAMAAGVGALSGALLWALRTPTRIQAIRFAVTSILSIALVALAQHDPVIATLTLTPLSLMASYIALFHSAWLMALNLTVATLGGAVEAARLLDQFNVVTGVVAFALLLMLNLAVPFGVQVVVHVLGSDALLSEQDQLTGLLTRRAFQRGAVACLERAVRQQGHVVVSVIDLDRFKQLNDTYGHSTGDDALVAVSRALRDATDDTAVIGRSGGEEFVIAGSWHPDDVSGKARQLCDVIAALSFGITASVGTAGVYPALRSGSVNDLLIELIVAADTAMYAAKRNGGNQAGHHEWPRAQGLSNIADDMARHGGDGRTA